MAQVVSRARHVWHAAARQVDDPIRSELFSVDRLVEHAASLADAHRVKLRPSRGVDLLATLDGNAQELAAAYHRVVEAVEHEQDIVPAEEWFLDNYHIVDAQLREVREHLPRHYYRRLPKLTEGHLEGYPRVYGVVWAYVAHTDSAFETEAFRRYLRAYQQVQPLMLGELWAIAIHLRLALVENLRRLAVDVDAARDARAAADAIADQLLARDEQRASRGLAMLRRLEGTPLADAFVVRLVQRLRDRDPSTTPALRWLEEKLAADGTTSWGIVSREHQDQAAANATVRHIITSMRWMSSIDWFGFVESVSLLDDELGAVYPLELLNFATRDEYRRQVEDLARRTELSEVEVAHQAAELAAEARGTDATARTPMDSADLQAYDDPGYYLLGAGREQLEARIGHRQPLVLRIHRIFDRYAIGGYVAAIALLTVAQLVGLGRLTLAGGTQPWLVAILGVLAVTPASEAAQSIVQRVVAIPMPPRRIPKLDLADGIPPTMRTLVAVPTLLANVADVAQQLQQLQVHFLANSMGHVHFALVSDFTDAPEEHLDGDDEIFAALVDGVQRLNAAHPALPNGGDRFLVLHRPRRFNPTEGCWMGWERKRGKLHELNRWLRGENHTSFLPVNGMTPKPPHDVRYVITLDADTRVPKGGVHRLVGAMAHPMNRAVFDVKRGYVVGGYGILQPRITPTLAATSANTLYHRLTSGDGGVDPYAAAVSDVYQDLVEQGSYTGKGIYDVDAFEAALEGKAADNTLLSHDLFEGTFARSGLVSDIELFEDFPNNYLVDSRRRHRWVRGDWQLLPWILGHAKDRQGQRAAYSMPAPGRWKMLDNLRRSLVAPSSFGLVIAAVAAPTTSAMWWLTVVGAAVIVPAFIPVIDGLRPPRRTDARSQLRAVRSDVARASALVAIWFVTLAHQAQLMLDAVVRALVRCYITKRKLLEWTPSMASNAGIDLRPRTFYAHMFWSVALAAVAVTFAALVDPASWRVIALLATIWLVAPFIAAKISTPPRAQRVPALSATDRQQLRLIARRTWNYFASFVSAERHQLPPDNFQESPNPVVANRTSPTNIGLSLLSSTVAYDFGWIGVIELTEQLERTLDTVDSLQKHRGHLFNWYDTSDLRPLEPLYVSTVDSGNFAGHLLALSQACREIAGRPVFGARVFDGIRDALLLALDAAPPAARTVRSHTVNAAELHAAVHAMLAQINGAGDDMHVAALLATLAVAADDLVDVAGTLSVDQASTAPSDEMTWPNAVRDCVNSHSCDANARAHVVGDAGHEQIVERLENIARRAEALVGSMDFRFLYDDTQKLFSIGYRIADATLDPSSYDLLASESRLASFVAIAKADAPPQHWFVLGRTLTSVGRGAALVSWSGSMFEYLMPMLVMREPPASLLDATCANVVTRQIAYGAERGIPWGVSESAHNIRDVELTYQYSDFGIPGLGLRRGLGRDIVVAPYATALAAMVDPHAALANFRHLDRLGARGSFGYYEAIDFTPGNIPTGDRYAIVHAYMAHHQAMSLVALGNVIHDRATQRRFHTHPLVRATELLLQERTPRTFSLARPRAEDAVKLPEVRDLVAPTLRHFGSPHDVTPRSHLLSNGRYSVMLTSAGSGFSTCRGLAVTRWKEDPTRDCWGSYMFMRDVENGEVWSAGLQPTGIEFDDYRVVYTEDRARITQRNRNLETNLEVIVSPHHDAELRRIAVTNRSSRVREIDITSYAEIVLNTRAADDAHPAFSNLFVQTEWVPHAGVILATRRPRAADEQPVWLAHLLTLDTPSDHPLQFETDRARFIGRGRTLHTAWAVHDGGPLSNTVGTVLDPIVSLRQRLTVPPGRTISAVLTTLVAETRTEAIDIALEFRQPGAYERESGLAWTHAQVQLHHLRITPDEAHLYQRLANRLMYTDGTLRAPPAVLAANRLGQSGLWPHGISGDLPIMLVDLERTEDRDVVRQLFHAHEYWRLKGLDADLVVINATGASYAAGVHEALEGMARATRLAEGDAPGRVYLLRDEQLTEEDRTLLRATARVEIRPAAGSLSQHVARARSGAVEHVGTREQEPITIGAYTRAPRLDLEMFNGTGGFDDDGKEYVVVLGPGQVTPSPWMNVIANPDFGFQVSALGAGYTWSDNSRENRLTPWSNDPVTDPPGEVLYLCDEDSGEVWTPTASPIRDADATYTIRHGQGYSNFSVVSHGIRLELVQFVPPSGRVKVSRLLIENKTSRTRNLSLTSYVEWVLGVSRSVTAPHVVTEHDAQTDAIFASNAWNGEFSGRVAFCDLGGAQTSWTADRLEFLGRNGNLDAPLSPSLGEDLSGRTGAGFDPCGALRTAFELEPGDDVEVLFLLGEANSAADARTAIEHYRAADLDALYEEVRHQWDDVLGRIQVRTPERSMDLLLNRWLGYQTLSCRIWARTGFHQSGGAFGFRDQLQDILAIVHSRPDLVREHLLRAAPRQFPEGDVQHWWHPPTGRGVRTRISDDRVWLVYGVTHYLRTTADVEVLDEQIPWLNGPPLDEDVHDAYFEPTATLDTDTLFEHCARALERTLEFGPHGLPLIGGGDWNDGMNRVGHGGRGESVWLAWFLIRNLYDFAPVAESRGETERADKWRTIAEQIRRAVEDTAWDGQWYRRAYFDDQTPLGSSVNDECQIDSIAQSWAVMSGVADESRASQAMASSLRRLKISDEQLMLLFSPPFDRTRLDPGYIKGYAPGLRENGGQYTHAATWSIIALAMLGDGDEAVDLFSMLNPIQHASSRSTLNRYKGEPYVMAADVYSQAPHTGRAGWTWYTGAAGWMYRAGIEHILGITRAGDTLHVDPCIPRSWPGFEIDYRHGTGTYRIVVTNPHGVSRGVASIRVDGTPLANGAPVCLVDDHRDHRVEVTLGPRDAHAPERAAVES